jgi:hypothetical protein
LLKILQGVLVHLPLLFFKLHEASSYISEYVLNQQLGFVSISGDNQNANKNGIITTPFYNSVNNSNGINILNLKEIYMLQYITQWRIKCDTPTGQVFIIQANVLKSLKQFIQLESDSESGGILIGRTT